MKLEQNTNLMPRSLILEPAKSGTIEIPIYQLKISKKFGTGRLRPSEPIYFSIKYVTYIYMRLVII